MKALTFVLALFIYLKAAPQSLVNTEWIKIKTATNGSQIISHNPSDQLTVKYYFEKDSVLIALDGTQYSFKLKYSLNEGSLSIGNFLKYKIDSMDNDVIAITDVSKTMSANKKNHFNLISCNSIFEYLSAIDNIAITGDSLIECDTQISPTYVGTLEDKFKTNRTHPYGNYTLFGELIISNQGRVKRVTIFPNDKFSTIEIDSIVKTFSSAKGSWKVPFAPKNIDYKINFSLNYLFSAPVQGFTTTFTKFSIVERVAMSANQNKLTEKELNAANNYFDRAVELIKDDKFEKGIKLFIKCIDIDSSYVDAYYNLAYSYQRTGDSILACETLNKLKALGQKPAEYLIKMNCK